MRNTNNRLTDVKLNKSHLSNIIQSGSFLGKTLGNMISNLEKSIIKPCYFFG